MKQRLLALIGAIGARDLFVVGGLLLLSIGAGMVYTPAALIVAGLAMLAIGIFGLPRWS